MMRHLVKNSKRLQSAHPARMGTATQKGYSLLEILIAVLVLSIGLLGLAGLQTFSMQSNQSAAQVSQATFLTEDLLDRMRANRQRALGGDYDINFGDTSDDYGGTGVHNADRQGWLRQMETVLPGTAEDDCGSAGGGDCGAQVRVDGSGYASITIRWVDRRRDDDDDQRMASFTTDSQI